ncbi:hypothetical protein GGP41_000759 [Bipolaris sorokiniana]|uniref:Uncharacterized protein n=1 Tax=Cochliobolus sativus TaxID=45130 RepID=A0A8H5ZPN6_COCSA|nr:hypothetical protein GGP41_000759 [Bipolaris sorokiniana]
MRVSLDLTFGLVLFSTVNAYVIPSRNVGADYVLPSRRIGAVKGISLSPHANSIQHDAEVGHGVHRRNPQGLMIGGLTLGGPDGGITGDGLNLGGNGNKGNGTAMAAGVKGKKPKKEKGMKGEKPAPAEGGEKPAGCAAPPPAGEGEKPKGEKPAPAEGGEKPAPPAGGEAPAGGEKPAPPAGGEAPAGGEKPAPPAGGEAPAGESEKFSEESGISLGKSGEAANLGGNLGITKGSDGSSSVGGKNGINVAASGY